MTDIKNFIEKECDGKIEGYREGGDDFVANFPTKHAALRAGIDSAWHALNHGAMLRAGIGKSRRESGERAQIADEVKIWNNSPVMVFDIADGTYAYYIPSEFSRSIMDFLMHGKSKAVLIFIFVFVATFIGWSVGYWEFGIVSIFLALLYAVAT